MLAQPAIRHLTRHTLNELTVLDFSCLADSRGNKPSLSIHDRDLKFLEPAFLDLEQKTGIYIDPYGTTRVYPAHQQILVDYLHGRSEEQIVEFVRLLKNCIREDEVLVADGD
ncbi:hypothetical protein [Pseudomonas piscis]|uniref:hypothetical protein n=1 Tax=Pseudomonas piscis TaxID=2614538 RepID=UPI0021D5B35D|nr:hypothetical protein [Pseudomonas piscis]MCU7646526.1 hypothetical protein [Pseudomonas piscis]